MQKLYLTLLAAMFLLPLGMSGQSIWSTWDSTYREINVKQLIEEETHNALEIDRGKIEEGNHQHIEHIRFPAKYKMHKRPIEAETLGSIKRVYSIYGGNPNIIDFINYEVLIETGGLSIWMPVQEELLKELKRSTRKKRSVVLYCIYLNEHPEKGKLFHHFIISEMRAIPGDAKP